MRVLSARYHTQIAVYAHATAPVSGDFTGLSLEEALKRAAKQANLEVKPLGAAPADGYALRPAPAKDALLAAAAKRRQELLRERLKLNQEEKAQEAAASSD